MVADPLLSVPVPTTALPLLASFSVTVSPLAMLGLTLTVKLTVWPLSAVVEPLSVRVVVLFALTKARTTSSPFG